MFNRLMSSVSEAINVDVRETKCELDGSLKLSYRTKIIIRARCRVVIIVSASGTLNINFLNIANSKDYHLLHCT